MFKKFLLSRNVFIAQDEDPSSAGHPFFTNDVRSYGKLAVRELINVLCGVSRRSGSRKYSNVCNRELRRTRCAPFGLRGAYLMTEIPLLENEQV